MRDKKRIRKICEKLAEIWESNVPDWRLTQMFCNLQRACGNDLFYMEDDDLIKRLKECFNMEELNED